MAVSFMRRLKFLTYTVLCPQGNHLYRYMIFVYKKRLVQVLQVLKPKVMKKQPKICKPALCATD